MRLCPGSLILRSKSQYSFSHFNNSCTPPTHFCHIIKKVILSKDTHPNVRKQIRWWQKYKQYAVLSWLSDGSAYHSGCHLTPLWILCLLLRSIFFLFPQPLCSKAWIDKLVPESISVTCIAVITVCWLHSKKKYKPQWQTRIHFFQIDEWCNAINKKLLVRSRACNKSSSFFTTLPEYWHIMQCFFHESEDPPPPFSYNMTEKYFFDIMLVSLFHYNFSCHINLYGPEGCSLVLKWMRADFILVGPAELLRIHRSLFITCLMRGHKPSHCSTWIVMTGRKAFH